jgi:hypothetical protein
MARLRYFIDEGNSCVLLHAILHVIGEAMKFELFKTFWGFDGGPRDAAPLVRAAGFDGIEAPVPPGGAEREAFAQAIADERLEFIAEITTAGSYVPERSATPRTTCATSRKKSYGASHSGRAFSM